MMARTLREAHACDRRQDEREVQRVDPGDVEPPSTEGVGGEEESSAQNSDLAMAGLARHHPGDERGGGQRARHGNQAQGKVPLAGDQRHGRGDDVVERVVDVGNEGKRRSDVEIAVLQQKPDMVHHRPLHPLQIEGVSDAAPDDPGVNGGIPGRRRRAPAPEQEREDVRQSREASRTPGGDAQGSCSARELFREQSAGLRRIRLPDAGA
jgi:hypothetical protein